MWNCDELALFYPITPSSTIGPRLILGHKKDKTRATFLACTNSSGSEKFPLLVVDHSARPRWFRSNPVQKLEVLYKSSKKAWMTNNLLFECLRLFDRYIARTPSRRLLFFTGNASSHGTPDSLPNLQKMRVEFLPP